MASSESANKKTTAQENTRDRRQRVELQRIQNVLLIWLDSRADNSRDDCRSSVTRLRRAVNDVNTYVDVEQCIEFIKTIKNNKVCMVISDFLGQHVVPRVHSMAQVDSILIFCRSSDYQEPWVKNWPKIRGVFSEITAICEALRQAAQQCEQNTTPMSFIPSNVTGDRLVPSFMYTQIFKEILLTIDFNEQHIQEYVDYCREAFQDNTHELNNVKKLEQHYREKTPIWWYTCECFLYPMLNKALRTMDGSIMIRLGFFINDLHRQLEREHQRQYAGHDSSTIFTVYRGQGLSKTALAQLTKINGGLISFNSFLSTSKERDVSLNFTRRATNNPDQVGVLFEMTIDPSQSMTPFASIRDLSAIEGEDEVLFAMHSVFRVHGIKRIDGNNRLYEVHLSLTSDNDPQLRLLADRIREESFPNATGWFRLASISYKMGHLDRTVEIYETLLDREMDESSRALIYNQLGLIKEKQDKYEEAIAFYEKALAIKQQSLPPTHPVLATSYNNIGNVYNSMGNYSEALASHEKGLAIRQQSLPSTHPNLAKSHNNIGSVYYSMGDYPQALASYENALAIRQQSLPSIHPDLATSYNNIGSVYYSMGYYPEALASYEKALAIQQQSLPSTHPDLAISYNNIAKTFDTMGNYSKAYSSLERAVKIGEQSLPSSHPNLRIRRKNLERIRKKL